MGGRHRLSAQLESASSMFRRGHGFESERNLAVCRAARLALALASLSLGCQPRIGDDCNTNQQCSGETQRLCDTSQSGGYCTVLNCSPTSCPSGEAVCVLFNSALSPLPACQSSTRPSPYARSMCMKYCDDDADCREGYACVDVSGKDPWAAEIVSSNTSRKKICIVPPVSEPLPPDRETEVCRGPSGADEAGEGGASQGGASQGGAGGDRAQPEP